MVNDAVANDGPARSARPARFVNLRSARKLGLIAGTGE